MKQFNSVVAGIAVMVAAVIVIAVITSMAWGDQVAEPRYQGLSLLAIDRDVLARALRDYGMWREEHDRNTFPKDMPKIGEPYDPVTGNAIRKEGR